MIKYILCFLLSFSCFADCPQKVSPIERGEVAACSGFLFSDQAEKEAAQARDDAAFYKKVNDQLVIKSNAQTKENDILERRLQLYMKQSDVLAKDVASRDNTDGLYRLGYFALGVLVTGFIASNVGH